MKKNSTPLIQQDTLIESIIKQIVMIVFSVVTIFPILRIISVSLRPGDRLLSTSLRIIPLDATWDNYITLISNGKFFLWIWNSAIITLITAVIGLSIAAFSAYAVSRWKFRGRSALLLFLLGTQMIPAAMLIIPLFIIATKLSLVNTYSGIILAYSVQAVPFSIWILKGYYDTIPRSLEEAAEIDGAPKMYIFFKIILPLTLPALAVAFLFNFMSSWNEFMLASIMLRKSTMHPWTLGLRDLQGQYQTAWGQYSAGSVLISIPVVFLFYKSSRFLVSGLTMGSVKE
ncbi:ABC transporter permease subunit [Thiospirochaeta perfilievii]|uniref:Maltose/maltodextrin transport system permease protein MalG n=1 Tax=Thiospirochaeta perfilievii TaxID=252967 RepID=A0A5C1QH28_9SPIO|nr:ABC transporter permease subunit [Thiospirochaeta perfilievii]QEN06300.1 ABC transporter permease subunit [Thiospirochaeta perfilievii]